MGTSSSTGEGLPGATFDPARVPAYPVITLTGADDPDNVTVDGAPFAGEDAFDQALAACAERAGELGGAVRVRGIDRHGTAWPMVITSSGELHDLPGHPDSPIKPSRAKVSRRALLIGGAGVVLTGGIAGGLIAHRAVTAPEEPPPPPLYPGQGANVPVVPPDGVGTVAQWAVTIADNTVPTLLSDQRIVLTTASGALVIVDALTGQLQWSGTPAGDLDQVGQLTIGDTPVLASYADDEAVLWPLDDPSTPSPQTLTVAEGRAKTVMTSSPAPLWMLEPQTVSYLAGNTLATVDVPVPAIPAGTHDGNAVAVSAGTWISITPDNVSTEHALEGSPSGSAPLQARVLGPEHLAILWGTDDAAALTLHELPHGALIGQLQQLERPRQSDDAEPQMSPDGMTWTWNNTLIRPLADTPLTSLTRFTLPDADDAEPQLLEVSALSDTTIWGSVDRIPTRYDTTAGVTTYYDAEAAIPVGESSDSSLVYIVASRLEETSLYALPSTPPATSDGGA